MGAVRLAQLGEVYVADALNLIRQLDYDQQNLRVPGF